MRTNPSNLFAVALTAGSLLAAPLVAADDADPCRGHWVQTLGGPHAILRPPLTSQADLRQRLNALEASMRSVITGDPSLGPVVADALIAQIRDGSGITERAMRRDEAILWMAYQPSPGRFQAISPACLRLMRDYDSFEIAVEIPGPVPAAPAANCAVSVTRSCAEENATFQVDTRGSSPGAQLTMGWEGQTAMPLSGQGEVLAVEDPRPRDSAAIFTVRAQGAPVPARTARVFRFLIPKICGNLAYLGEAPNRTLAVEGSPATCEKSVRAERCAAVTAPPPPVEPLVASCEDSWIARPFVFGFFPSGDKVERGLDLASGPARESFELDNGYGVGFSLERRRGAVFGIETSVLFGRGDSRYQLSSAAVTGHDTHDTTFYALTVGPNFHLLGCRGTDLYLGPFIGYGGFGDPNYWVDGNHFAAQLDGRFVWGARLGLDVPFHAGGPWGFHGGLRYLKLSQNTDAGSIRVDPWIVEAGLSYRF